MYSLLHWSLRTRDWFNPYLFRVNVLSIEHQPRVSPLLSLLTYAQFVRLWLYGCQLLSVTAM